MDLQKNCRERAADDGRRRNRREEDRDGLAAIFRAVPVTQINDDARDETGFRDTQNEAQPVELLLAADQARERRDQAPGDHDAGDPLARAPDFREYGPGHFEQKIPNEENAAAEAEDVVRKAQFAGHLQAGEAYVYAVEIGDQVEQEHERHQPPVDVPAGALGDIEAHIHELTYERRSVAR